MKVAVLGAGHLGSVTAAGLAILGHDVVGVDSDESQIAGLNAAVAPVVEPGLEKAIRQGRDAGRLRFSTEAEAIRGARILWIALDTPVQADGHADTEWVFSRIERVLLALDAAADADIMVLVSSQLPVGSVARLERFAAGLACAPRIACSPENLRVGRALADFLNPHRIVVGVRSASDRGVLASLLGSITRRLEWMSVESAEMSKHALNAFLAASVAYANEIASICETVGADAKEVERALKSDERIGPRAYLAPGAPFAGTSLARDIGYLNALAGAREVAAPLLASILVSNERHKSWPRSQLRARFDPLSGLTAAVWGLAYKPHSGALRGSFAVELCDWLIREGAKVQIHDAVVRELPSAWGSAARRFDQPIEALDGAQALIVAADSPLYRAIRAGELERRAPGLVILDADRVLRLQLGDDPALEYLAPGTARSAAPERRTVRRVQ